MWRWSALPPSGLSPDPYPTTTRATFRRKTAGRIAPQWTRIEPLSNEALHALLRTHHLDVYVAPHKHKLALALLLTPRKVNIISRKVKIISVNTNRCPLHHTLAPRVALLLEGSGFRVWGSGCWV